MMTNHRIDNTIVVKLHYYCYLNFEVELVSTVVCSQSLLHMRFLNTVTNFDPSDVELSLRLVIECDVFVI